MKNYAGEATQPQANLFDVEAPPDEVRYETVTTEAQLESWMRRLDEVDLVCIDTETTSIDPMLAQLVGISLSVKPARHATSRSRIAGPMWPGSTAPRSSRAMPCSHA
ncbi:hypothetical protein GCM10023069_24150 [Shinella granuli]